MASSKSTAGVVLAVIIQFTMVLSGCSHLILRHDDDPAATTAKVTARVMLGIISAPLILGGFHSEIAIARIKNSAAVTDGFHNNLPPEKATVVVLGDHPSATGAAVTWLQKRGLTIVERTGLQKVFSEQQIRLTHTSDDEAAFLKVGRLMGATVIVFVETSTSSGSVSQGSMYVSKYGGHGETYSTTVNSSGVSVRAVDVENGSLAWTGHAHYPMQTTDAPEAALVKLTCQSLATAWGFRPAGSDFIPSQEMCELKELRPSSR